MAITKVNTSYLKLKGSRLASSSMLNMFNIMHDGNDYFMNIFKSFVVNDDILNNPNNTELANVIDPWWENIANTYYGDVDLWWVPCVINDVINPFEELDEAQSLNMLKKSYVPYIHRDMQRIFEA